jgi:hypothetical protein
VSVLDKQKAVNKVMRVITDVLRILEGNMKVGLFLTIFYRYLLRPF